MIDAGVYLVLRTHFWSNTVAAAAARWATLFGSDNVVILADETHTHVPCAPYRKIVFRNDQVEPLGLMLLPSAEKTAWFNGDYGFYFAHMGLGDYRYMFIAEYDVLPQVADLSVWKGFLAAQLSYDISSFSLRDAEADFPYTAIAGAVYERPGQALLCFAGLRRHVVEALLERRRCLAAALGSGQIVGWPMGEVFCGSEIFAHPEWRHFELLQSPLLDRAWFSPGVPYFSEVAAAATSVDRLIHPSLDKPRFIEKLKKVIRSKGRSARERAMLSARVAEIAPALSSEELFGLILYIKAYRTPEDSDAIVSAIEGARGRPLGFKLRTSLMTARAKQFARRARKSVAALRGSARLGTVDR